jgi:hypothetical protein
MAEHIAPMVPQAAILADQVHSLSGALDGVSAQGRAFLAGAETALRAVAATS